MTVAMKHQFEEYAGNVQLVITLICVIHVTMKENMITIIHFSG